jgi:4,4'-diapolycopenoate synthase
MIFIEPLERVRRARIAQLNWREKSVSSRSLAMRKLRRVFAAQRDRIVDGICAETGKPRLDALSGDVMVTLEQMRYYESHACRLLRTGSVGKPSFLFVGTDFYEEHEPYGVVLIYGPANYPFQLSVVPMITALFAGNAVILKCSEKTPGVARLIESLCHEAGLPEDLVQIVTDAPEGAAPYIDAGPDLIFFTGSSENGRSVATSAARRLIPAVLELGGKDAAAVFADCNLERAVEGVLYGAFSNAGQVCVGIKRLYIEESLRGAFVKRLVGRMEELRIGAATNSDLGVLQGETARTRLCAQIADAIQRGAILEYPQSGPVNGEMPVLLRDVPAEASVLVEETFGPVLCVTSFKSEDEAIALANGCPFALSASIWTSDLNRARRMAKRLSAGTCAVNDVIRNIANPYAAFGGNRQSGYGRYHGPQGLSTFSRIKSVMVSNGKRKREINWFPFTKSTLRRLDVLLGWRHGVGELLSGIRRLFMFALISAAIALPVFGQNPNEGRLRLRVTVPNESHGSIAYLIFSSSHGFPNEKAKAVRSDFVAVRESDSAVTIDVGTLTPGRYAISVYQDINGNHKLDTGMFGIPNEPVGASNNPKPRMGPPRFEDCAFSMGNSDQTISISLVRPK